MNSGPVLFGYDGSPAAENAIREAGALLRGRRALVLVVWEADLGFELMQAPPGSLGLEPAALDVSAALEINRELAKGAQRAAQHGAAIAREAGFEADGLAVADDPASSVPETIVRIARERAAQTVVLAPHNKGRLSEILLGSTSREVVRQADEPVLIVREGAASAGGAAEPAA
jgi:nucleotide-binding universal stress UspA family protein